MAAGKGRVISEQQAIQRHLEIGALFSLIAFSMALPPSHKTYLSSSLKDKCVVPDAITFLQILPTFQIYRKSEAGTGEEVDTGPKKQENNMWLA